MFQFLFIFGFLAVFIGVFLSMLKSVNKKNSDSQTPPVRREQSETSHGKDDEFSSQGSLNASQRAYLDGLRQKKASQNSPVAPKNPHGDSCPAVTDAHAHEHVGFEEHYAPIVGSLGSVEDEGCSDLDGVRLIENDPDYAPFVGDDGKGKNKLAKIMVLGEVLDNPAWKKPYGRK